MSARKSLISKIIYHRVEVFLYILRMFSSIIAYPLRFFLFESIHLTAFISMKSSLRNRKCIIIKRNAAINDFVVLWPTKLKIGVKSQLNPGTAIYGEVTIGDYVMIGPNCMIAGGNHNFEKIHEPMMTQGSNEKGIIIEDNVWIGANSTILDGVIIGTGAIIGANSLVSKNVPQYSIVTGNPAKVIKIRKDIANDN